MSCCRVFVSISASLLPAACSDLFDVPVKEVWLEIGFGSGEHLLWQAEHHTDIGFIGCEPFVNGVASLLGAIETTGSRPSASMTAMRARCSPGFPTARSRAPSFCFPTLGRRSGSRSGGSSRPRPSRSLRACLRRAASSDLPATMATTPRRRFSSCARAAPSPGWPSGQATGGPVPPIGPRRATSGRP